MLRLFVKVQTRLNLLAEEHGDIGVEYVVIAAVLGGAVLVGATVLRGAIEGAFNRVVNLVNGVG